jgi:hypothetical protein
MFECSIGPALPLFHASQLPVEERACRRRGNGSLVGDARRVELPRRGRGSRLRDSILDGPELQNLDATGDVRQTRVSDEGRLEAFERFVVTLEGQERLTATDERRRVAGRGRQDPIEARERGGLVAAREIDVAERRLGGVEPGRSAEDCRELVRRPAQIAALEQVPRLLLPRSQVRVCQRWRHGRKHEVRV